MQRLTKLDIEQNVVFHSGFRPFFLLALISGLLLVIVWSLVYSFGVALLREDYPFINWHAHEMVFAYAAAVVSGFLLTAIQHWTGLKTVSQRVLVLLVFLWVTGRLLPFVSVVPLAYLVIHELLFFGLVLFHAMRPLVQKRIWQKQWLVFGVLGLFPIASVLFHLGLLGILASGIQLGLYLGLYLLVALILVMGRRVIPGFIENAIGGGFRARNHELLDRISRVVLLFFIIAELAALTSGDMTAAAISSVLALLLFLMYTIRLLGWHHRHIWLHPLLWSLFLAYAWMALGFLLKFLVVVVQVNPWAVLHAFAYGGIGLVTAGMMARVTLGHTGRNVFASPESLGIWFGLLLAGSVVRVFPVMLWPEVYQVWILTAQILWIGGFAGLLFVLAPMLLRARVDGKEG